ncbi:TorF family putative porin [Alkanindiges illinoisensis]|uniref:Porin n=1 Tax=Alkanindiges illinoisensis TaxID=197183 RepID=A0A4Y7XDJ7_9GAMM|nr:TorF family putative porin [Alkanindiges illinoisensis]TEU26877.1 hypothetical protein E2B99_07675 [Alkanindiges illinoisensis]
MKGLKQIAVTGCVLALMSHVQAADVITVPGVTTTGNVTLSTDYRFRGISQTSNNPAIQGAVNFNHESGTYASLWASNVSGNSTAEIDGVLGYATKLNLIPNRDTTLDVGYIRYMYAGSGDSAPGSKQPDYNELFGRLSLAGSVIKEDNLMVGANYSNDYFNQSDNFWYFSANYTAPIKDTGFGLVAGIGYNLFKNSHMMNRALGTTSNDDSYIDYKLGTSFGVQGLTTELAWVETSLKDSECVDKKACDGTVQLSISKTF